MNAVFAAVADWPVVHLEALCEGGGASIQTGPFGNQLHASDYVMVGIPCVMPQDIRGGRIVTGAIARISDSDHQRLARFHLRQNDIVYPRRGDISKRALIGEREEGWLCGTGCLRIRSNPSKVNAAFLAYYLSHPEVCGWLEANAVGATMPHLNTGLVGAVPVLLPPLPEQREIASILGVLDDKIELNRKTAAVLEEMARALYRSWFVDFDPVWAKAEGRPPAHMDATTAALFPDGFDDEGLPLGWAHGIVEDLFILQRGFDLPASTRTDGPYPVFAAGGHHGTHIECKVKGPGVTTGRSGVIGEVYLILEDFWPLNTSLWVKDFKRGSAYFTYFFMRTLDLKSLNSGSAVPSLNRNNVHNLTADIPPETIVSAFGERVEPIFSKVAALEKENQTLATLRDSLLPRLMSGELRVGAARGMLSEVA